MRPRVGAPDRQREVWGKVNQPKRMCVGWIREGEGWGIFGCGEEERGSIDEKKKKKRKKRGRRREKVEKGSRGSS